MYFLKKKVFLNGINEQATDSLWPELLKKTLHP
jgi:hypothetical protein